ncbi:MAG: hypothetical protein KGK09_10495, partial [Burkholderiales bacterium]|nr:hypothetical protein [Burkholderiales bacterium]
MNAPETDPLPPEAAAAEPAGDAPVDKPRRRRAPRKAVAEVVAHPASAGAGEGVPAEAATVAPVTVAMAVEEGARAAGEPGDGTAAEPGSL